MATPASADAELANREAYQQKLQGLLDNVRARHAGDQLSLNKKTSNLFRNRGKRHDGVNVRDFQTVISVDSENRIAEVEGMTTYADLVDATLQYDLLPSVVPELKSITIGGALSGLGIESSSFRYGLVHETIMEFDVLLGNGRVVTARADNEHRDLFYAFPNSYGCLGYALKIKVKLIPAKRYVKLTYHKFSDPNAYFNKFNELCLKNHGAGRVAYVDGAVFAENELVVAEAEFVDEAPYVSNYQYMQIYYRSLTQRDTDYLTAHDYIWRWDTDWFWCSKVFFMQNPLLRFLFGKWMLKSVVYWKLKSIAYNSPMLRKLITKCSRPTESVIQDVAIPIENAPKFLAFFQKEIGIKPVWTCPLISLPGAEQYQLFSLQPGKLYINFGFWDMVPTTHEEGFYNRLVENKVRELGGNKSLYSNVFYSEKEFWQIYNGDAYFAVKQKYDPTNRLADLYKKCSEKG